MTINVLIVDDEELARARLRTLLADCDNAGLQLEVVGEAASASQALACLQQRAVDLVLLDIHMPGAGGIGLAQCLRELPDAPRVVFVTAHAQHALEAFEIDAIDYLTKPVRLERLQQALRKVERQLKVAEAADADSRGETLLIRMPGYSERVPLREVLFFRAELKYLTVRTRQRSYLLEASLSEIEARYAADFLRVHRSALVARRALRALERQDAAGDAESWVVRLSDIDEALPVSRRQLAAVRDAIVEKTARSRR